MRPPRPTATGAVALVLIAGSVAMIVAALAGVGGSGTPGEPEPPAAAAPVPKIPDWGEFPGSPPPLEMPPGGAAVATAGEDEVTLRRSDGTVFAVYETGDAGEVLEVRYHDAGGRATVAISRLAAPPSVAAAARIRAARARVRCVDARRGAGWRWRALPIRWQANRASTPRYLSRAATLRAMRAARGTWVLNRNRCRERDASRAAFRYTGATRAAVGQNGVSTIGFGEVDALGGNCVGAIACAITFLNGRFATESDVRMDRNPTVRYGTGNTGRRFDLTSVLVHESGHTLGFDHVSSPDNVMSPYLPPGDRTARRLGRGDARANNAAY